jgi:hypothetical protein
MQEGEEKNVGGNKRGFEPVASLYSTAQLLERGDLPMRQNRLPKKGEQRAGYEIRNHDLRVVHRRRGGAGNTTAASTKGRQIRRTGATGKRRLRRTKLNGVEGQRTVAEGNGRNR